MIGRISRRGHPSVRLAARATQTKILEQVPVGVHPQPGGTPSRVPFKLLAEQGLKSGHFPSASSQSRKIPFKLVEAHRESLISNPSSIQSIDMLMQLARYVRKYYPSNIVASRDLFDVLVTRTCSADILLTANSSSLTSLLALVGKLKYPFNTLDPRFAESETGLAFELLRAAGRLGNLIVSANVLIAISRGVSRISRSDPVLEREVEARLLWLSKAFQVGGTGNPGTSNQLGDALLRDLFASVLELCPSPSLKIKLFKSIDQARPDVSVTGMDRSTWCALLTQALCDPCWLLEGAGACEFMLKSLHRLVSVTTKEDFARLVGSLNANVGYLTDPRVLAVYSDRRRALQAEAAGVASSFSSSDDLEWLKLTDLDRYIEKSSEGIVDEDHAISILACAQFESTDSMHEKLRADAWDVVDKQLLTGSALEPTTAQIRDVRRIVRVLSGAHENLLARAVPRLRDWADRVSSTVLPCDILVICMRLAYDSSDLSNMKAFSNKLTKQLENANSSSRTAHACNKLVVGLVIDRPGASAELEEYKREIASKLVLLACRQSLTEPGKSGSEVVARSVFSSKS